MWNVIVCVCARLGWNLGNCTKIEQFAIVWKKGRVLLLGLLGSWTYDLDLNIAIDLVSTMIINIIIYYQCSYCYCYWYHYYSYCCCLCSTQKGEYCPSKRAHYENVLQQVGQSPTIISNSKQQDWPREKRWVLLLGFELTVGFWVACWKTFS